MTALAFMTLVIGLVVGSVVGIAITFYRDTKIIRQIIREYETENARKKNEIEKYRAEINRYNALRALKEIRVGKFEKAAPDVEFWNVNDLPTHFKSDIDFGGKF